MCRLATPAWPPHERGAVPESRSLALALAETDRIAEATLLADEVNAGFHALKRSGLLLVLAYETRTRVAIRANNHADYQRFVDSP